VIARGLDRPDEVLGRVNDALVVQNPRNMFVTLACAVFQPRVRKVVYASAGHPSPVLLRVGEPPHLPFRSTGLVAGVMEGTTIPVQSLDLWPGDTFVFYTDGVTEAFNPAGQPFGEHGLIEHLARRPGQSATETLTSTLEAVRNHVGDHPQSDDIAIVTVNCQS
jgi:sigma-B regulation protein RsbU (phosphoserine phosphatase)